MIGLLIVFCYSAAIIASLLLTVYMPNIIWDLGWGDLIAISNNNTPSTDVANKISIILKESDITNETLMEWAKEKIILCIIFCLLICTILIYIASFSHRKKIKI